MCDNNVTWGVVPKGGTVEKPVWVCTLHLGTILEVLHKRDGPTYGFGYVGDQDMSRAKCSGAPGVGVALQTKVSVSTTPVEPPNTSPKVGASVSVVVQ
jgi:hypothetical protein